MINQNTANKVNSYAERLQRATTSRHRSLQYLFQSELFPLSSLMGPIGDGPEWPSSAAWLAFQHGNCGCIISDGLSDPGVKASEPATGLGLEVYMETPDIAFCSDDPMAIADSWLFPMTAEVSHTLASYPRLCEKLLAGEVLSARFNIVHIKDGRGLAGALLHVPNSLSSQIITEMGKITLVVATLITVEELRWLSGRGEAGRRALLGLLNEAGVEHRSLAQRPSVVEAL